MATKLIWEEKGVLLKHSGTVTNKEVEMMNDLMYGDPRFESLTYQIADYTEVNNNLISIREAQVIGMLDKTSSRWNYKKMRIGVVTKDEQFMPAVKIYFSQLEGTGWECKIFETLEEAHEWVRS